MMDLRTEMAPQLAEHYADMLSLDFRSRQAQLTSLNHNMGDLMAWDQRLQAYLDGLLLLRDEAGAYFDAQLLSPLSRGDVFALGAFAFASGNAVLLEGCCRLTQAMPPLLTVIGSVMEWAPVASPLWSRIDDYPALRVLAGWHRPDIVLPGALSLADIASLITQPAVIPALVLALSRQPHPEYPAIINGLLKSDDSRTVCGVLTAILTRHLPAGGSPVQALLRQLMQSAREEVRLQAVQLSLLCSSHPHDDTLAFIQAHTGDTRLYIQALGMAGTAAHIPLLREYLDVPDYARLSAAAISLLTGSRPEADGWAGTAPVCSPGEEAVGAHIPDTNPDDTLTWPDVPGFDRWWRNRTQDFDPVLSYLGGQPVTPSGMLRVLHRGAMALRPLAALRWQHITGRTAFSLSAPASAQQQQLQRLMTQDNPA